MAISGRINQIMLFPSRTAVFPSTSAYYFKQYYTPQMNLSTVLKTGERLLKCYELLGLTNECTKEQLKSRYIELAKKFHPDSNVSSSTGAAGDSEKFRQIAEAYKFIIDNDYGAKDKEELENLPKIFDIRHTAPQHRQYLEYGGVGYGTPGQRQRQYQQYRVQQAAENVSEYTMRKIMAKDDFALITKTGVEAEYARKWKTRNAIDRLVEDLIQESMKKGEFSNLAGQGKPLKYDAHNPYVDSMTHKLNQILIQNGFTPEWVLLEKEIKEQIRTIRKMLKERFQSLCKPGECWTVLERNSWQEFLNEFKDTCVSLNKQIDHFNLVCPALSKQMVRFQLNREADKLIRDSQQQQEEDEQKSTVQQTTENNIKPKTESDNTVVKRQSKNFVENNATENTGLLKNMFSTLSFLK